MRPSDVLRAAERKCRRWYRKRRFLLNAPNPYGISAQNIKKARKLGFTPEEYTVYQLDRNDPREYLSEYERELLRDGAKEYRILFDNKIVCYHLLRSFAPVNTIYGYRRDGRYAALEEGWDAPELLRRLMDCGAVVCKRIGAGSGKGFQLLEYREGAFFVNRTPADAEAVQTAFAQDNCLFEAYCRQSRFENDIWPYAVNTIRLITMASPGRSARAVLALHRFGMDQHNCVDNVYAGGLSVKIDLETGELSGAVMIDNGKLLDAEGNVAVYDRHPLTGAAIRGVRIPGWKQIVEKVVHLHNKLSFTGVEFIAWDLALTEAGVCVIEANTSCGATFMQVFGGVKKTEIGQWMQSKGYCAD